MEIESGTIQFLFEIGRLKRIPRSGWLLAGVTNSESVADHTFRVAIIGYILAVMENQDPEKILCMSLLHDLPETRLGDIDNLGKRYLNKNRKIESNIFEDQIALIRRDIKTTLSGYAEELFSEDLSDATLLVSDADKLECYIQALEYKSANNGAMEEFLSIDKDEFHTASAKQIFCELKNTDDPNKWWTRK